MMRLWLWREQLKCRRQLGQLALPLVFFIMFVSLFPLTLILTTASLKTLLPPVVWIGWMFSAMLSTERLFLDDVKDGHWLQWQLYGCDLYQLVWAKMLVNWLYLFVPMLLCMPWFILIYHVSAVDGLVLCLSLLAGTPVISHLVVLLSALLTATQQRQALFPLLLIPLALPMIVLGSGAQTEVGDSVIDLAPLMLMGGVSLIATALVPMCVVTVLKEEVRY